MQIVLEWTGITYDTSKQPASWFRLDVLIWMQQLSDHFFCQHRATCSQPFLSVDRRERTMIVCKVPIETSSLTTAGEGTQEQSHASSGHGCILACSLSLSTSKLHSLASTHEFIKGTHPIINRPTNWGWGRDLPIDLHPHSRHHVSPGQLRQLDQSTGAHCLASKYRNLEVAERASKRAWDVW